MDIVQVPVPVPCLPQVLRLVLDYFGDGEPPAPVPPVATAVDDNPWNDKQFLRRVYRESPRAMLVFLPTLARRPDTEVAGPELAPVVYPGSDNPSKLLGSALGAFSNRVKHRYRVLTLPFTRRWASEREPRSMVYRLRADIAAKILEIANELGEPDPLDP